MSLPATPEGRQDDAPLRDDGARNDACASELLRVVDRWIEHLRTRKKSPGTLGSYRRFIRSVVRARGWTEPAHLSYANVIDYMEGQVNSGNWKGGTFNRNLSCFRSLSRFMTRRGLIASDPLEDAELLDDDGEPDCRAATVAEARAIVREAYLRGESDRRSRGTRALYWACLFAHGCRPGEPALWRWKHVRIDEPVPFVRWLKAIQKNKQDQDVALAPELAALLRAHRERMRALAAESGAVRRRDRRNGTTSLREISPDDPEAFVFPHAPPRATFRKDREQAGVAAVDRRGLSVTPRSARKFFKTAMLGAGVGGDMVRRLMRHALHPDERYFDPSLEQQAAALSALPTLWPECAHPVENPSDSKTGLTTGGAPMEHPHATPMATTLFNPAKAPVYGQSPSVSQLTGPLWTGPFSGFGAPRDRRECGAAVESAAIQAGNGHNRIGNERTRSAVVDLLKAIVRVLQQGAPDDERYDDPSEDERSGAA